MLRTAFSTLRRLGSSTLRAPARAALSRAAAPVAGAVVRTARPLVRPLVASMATATAGGLLLTSPLMAEESAAVGGGGSGSAGGFGPGPRPRVIFVLGGPGAGKGTQCSLLVSEFGFIHLSAGDLLRAERNTPGSEHGELINDYIKEGKIVPVEITLALLRRAMVESGGSLFLIDGFPRNEDNLQGWLAGMGDVDVDFVLLYDCPEAELERRVLERGRTSGRADDNLESIRKRFRTYHESTMPIVDHFAKQGRVRKIDSTSSIPAVFDKTSAVVTPVVKETVLALNAALLEAISGGEWDTYSKLCHPHMTAFEPEGAGHLVEGLGFHKFYFDGATYSGSRSSMRDATVRLVGRTAVVTYVRVVQSTDPETKKPRTDTYEETRVWACEDGRWRNIHFHRSTPSATWAA